MKNQQNTSILGVNVSPINYQLAIKKIKTSIESHQKEYICVAAVHLVMECQDNKKLMEGVNKSVLITPDGMPLVWLLKIAGKKNTKRVYGPDLMIKTCQLAQQNNYKIFLVGGKKDQSKKLKQRLQLRFPTIKLVGHVDTPVRPIPDNQNKDIIDKINKSGAEVVFIGLGCPVQEEWMINNRPWIDANLLIGVGAAFDFISGEVKQAPLFMQRVGLEWLFRLLTNPKRLWKRYLITNVKFLYLLLTKHKFYQKL